MSLTTGRQQQDLNCRTLSNNGKIIIEDNQLILDGLNFDGPNINIGTNALASNTTGTCNVAVGKNALRENTSGSSNTAVGFNALREVVDDNSCTAVGCYALTLNQANRYYWGTASQSGTVVTGVDCMWNPSMVTWGYGTIVFENGQYATINQYDGITSLTVNESQTVASQSYVIYYSAFTFANITGTAKQTSYTVTGTGTSFNRFMVGGWIVYLIGGLAYAAKILAFIDATTLTVDRQLSIPVGTSFRIFNVDSEWSDYIGSTAVGGRALANTPNFANSTACGHHALSALTGGFNNEAVGAKTLFSLVNGSFNCAFGLNSLSRNLSGVLNQALGHDSSFLLLNGNENCAVGSHTLFNAQNSSQNTCVGNSSMWNNGYIVNFGTASQSGNTVTFVAAPFQYWTPDVVGGTMVFANNVIATITGFVNNVTLTAAQSQTVAPQSFKLYFGTLYTGGVASQTASVENYVLVGDLKIPKPEFDSAIATVTGVGTAFTAAMVGGYIVYNNGAAAQIMEYLSPTKLTVSFGPRPTPQTPYPPQPAVPQQAFKIYYVNLAIQASQNTAVGYQSLTNNTLGALNTAVGWQAGANNTTGNYNLLLGFGSQNSAWGANPNSDTIVIGSNAYATANNQFCLGGDGSHAIAGCVAPSATVLPAGVGKIPVRLNNGATVYILVSDN